MQALLGVAGFLGLVFTVVYARGAWLAGEKAAATADRTLAATRDGERRQLRAYVDVIDYAVDVEAGQPVSVRVVFRNCGVTPARNCESYTRLIMVEDGSRSEPLPPAFAPKKGRELSKGSLAAGADNYDTVPIDPEHRHLMGDPGVTAYVYGWVKYRDIFGIARITHFRAFTDHTARQAANRWFSISPVGNKSK